MKKLLLTIVFSVILGSVPLKSQVIEIAPLFEYPVAPEEMESLQEKCDYIVKNFWNNFDFKQKQPVDQYALNAAFQVYATSFQFASRKEVDASVDKLIKAASSNPILMLQICKAAEENLYGPRADFWVDSIYLKFVDALVKNKKISESRKKKYILQAQTLRESAEGNAAPAFWFQDKERASKQYFPMSTPTMLIFGNPDDTDWRLERIKMESNFKLSDALDKGKVNIIYIIPQEMEGWFEMISNYNPKWTLGQSEEASTKYDVRLNPAIYIIGSDGKINKKNVTPEEGSKILLEMVNQ